MQKSILDSIPDVKTQLLEEIREKQRDKEREQMAANRDKPKFVEEIKAQLGEDQEEIITTRRIPEVRPYSLSIEGPSSQAIVQEVREKSLMLEKSQKLERLLKVFKMLLHQFSKNSRNSHLSAEDKTKNKTLKEDWVKIIDTPQLKDLFQVFCDYLSYLSNSEVNDTVKMVGLAMFLCYQEDFKSIDLQVFTDDFNKPNIEMQQYLNVETKGVTNFIDEKFFK